MQGKRRRQRRKWVWGAVLVLSWGLAQPGHGQEPPPNFRSLPGLNPVQQAVAEGTDAFCDSPAGAGTDLNRSLCGGGFRGGVQSGTTDAETAKVGLQQLGYEEVAAQGTTAIEVSQTQFAHIGARLAALRGGATTLSLRRFALQRHEEGLAWTRLASLGQPMALASTTPAPPLVRRLGVFLTGTLAAGDKAATSREAGFDFGAMGITGGVDYRLTRWLVIGLAAGYTTTDVDLDATAGNLDVEGWSVSAYGTYQTPAGLYVDGIVTLGWNDYEMTRRIDYRFTDRTGASRRVNQTALGETAGRWYAASVGLGYDWQRRAWTLGPLLRVSYTRVDIDGFTEAVVFNPGNTEVGQHLTIDGQDLESLTTAVGVQMAYALSTPLGVLLPQAQLEWEHEFENDSRTLVARYVGDPGATPLRLRTDAPDRDFFNLGVGLTATLPYGISAFVRYQTVLDLAAVTVHSVALGVRLEL